MTPVKEPWVAAVLNILVPGLGYIYLDKKRAFSWMLLASTILFWVGLFMLAGTNDTSSASDGGSASANIAGVLLIVWIALIYVGFVVDAYLEARRMNAAAAKSVKK